MAKTKGQRSTGEKIDCDRILINLLTTGEEANEKSQPVPIQWRERPTGTLTGAAASLHPTKH